MKLSEISIERPVFATVMSLVIVIFGVIGFSRLPVREYPDIDPPIVSVTTFYRGASASVVETEITDVLEEQFATLEGVKTMSSSSREQGAVITIEFELKVDENEAANDVRDRVARVRGELPAEAEDPIVAKVDADAQPVMWLALSSDRHSELELTELADLVLKERIQRLPGVGSVIIGAERRYAMRVWLDPRRVAAHGLTTQDVERAIRLANAEIPGGRVEGQGREFAVRTRGELQRADEFGAIVVKQSADNQVLLQDIADVQVGAEDERTVARWNGRPALGLGIVKQAKASTVDVAAAIKAILPEMSRALTPGMELDVAYDSSSYILESIKEVRESLLIAFILVVLVILVFLKSFRATIIPSVAIPVSLLGAIAFAYFMGFTINILTLLALVLAIGVVVDDAIVVLENVYRHMEMGKPRLQATIDGSKEIGFAVVATTISLVAVFVPVAFLQGNVGRLFGEFGLSVAIAVLVSGFVALTLTPMMCSKLLRPLHAARGSRAGWATRSFDNFFAALDRTYEWTVRTALRMRLVVLLAALGLVVASYFIFRALPSELVPTEDRGTAFGVVIAPEGATLDYTDRYMREVERLVLATPERHGLFTAIGLGFSGPGSVTNGFMFLNLKPRHERERTQQEIVGGLFPQLISVPGVLAFLINPPSLGNFESSEVDYVLQAEDYESLAQSVGTMMAEAGKLGYIVNLDTDLRMNKPQLDIAIDRERASQLGVSVTDIGTTLEMLLGGRVVSDFKRGTKQYDVIVQVKPSDRATPDVIEGIYLMGSGGLVQLANVVNVSESVAPKELNHYNRTRAAHITGNLAPGATLGKALRDLDNIAQTQLPAAVRRDLAGQSLEYRESSGKLYLMFVLAVVFIFLVLAAQFESFIHPFTILLSVPLAVFGALLSLLILKQSLNIYSQIGLIMLVGLVTKNAILIVEFANQLRERGLDSLEAVAQAGITRLRPILMTSFSTVFGVLPIALGLGAGGEARRPLGIAVVGGIIFSTFLTLVVVPVVYALLARFTRARVQPAEQPAGVPRTALHGTTPVAAALAAGAENRTGLRPS